MLGFVTPRSTPRAVTGGFTVSGRDAKVSKDASVATLSSPEQSLSDFLTPRGSPVRDKLANFRAACAGAPINTATQRTKFSMLVCHGHGAGELFGAGMMLGVASETFNDSFADKAWGIRVRGGNFVVTHNAHAFTDYCSL